MAPASRDPHRLAHALVLQFLRHNNYTAVADAFAAEASDVLAYAPDPVSLTPLIHVIEKSALMQCEAEEAVLDRTRDKELLRTWRHPSSFTPHEHSSNEIATGAANPLCVLIHTYPSPCIIFSCSDRTLRAYSLSDNLPLTTPLTNPMDSPLLSMDTHPIHRNWLLVSAMNGGCGIVDLDTGGVVSEWHDTVKYCTNARFVGDDGRWIVTGGRDAKLRIYERVDDTGKYSSQWVIAETGVIESIAVLPASSLANSFIVGARGSAFMRLYTLPGSSETAYALKLSPPTPVELPINLGGDTHISFSPCSLTVTPRTFPGGVVYVACATDAVIGRVVLYRLDPNAADPGQRWRQVWNWYAGDIGAELNRYQAQWITTKPQGDDRDTVSLALAAFGADNRVRLFRPGVEAEIGALSDGSMDEASMAIQHTAVVRCLGWDESAGTMWTGGFDGKLKAWTFVSPS